MIDRLSGGGGAKSKKASFYEEYSEPERRFRVLASI